jgi:uncharacterized membrane protein
LVAAAHEEVDGNTGRREVAEVRATRLGGFFLGAVLFQVYEGCYEDGHCVTMEKGLYVYVYEV